MFTRALLLFLHLMKLCKVINVKNRNKLLEITYTLSYNFLRISRNDKKCEEKFSAPIIMKNLYKKILKQNFCDRVKSVDTCQK